MTHENAPIDPAAAPKEPIPKTLAGKAPVKKKRHWLRRVLVVLAILVVGLLVLVALIPTIASTGAVRSMVLDKVNQQINGKVTISSWSLGWTGGIKVDDLKIFDDQNRQILQIPHFSTQLSLVSAIRGEYHLGNTTVDGMDFLAERDENGELNFAKLLKSEKKLAAPGAPASPNPAPSPSTAPTPEAKPAEKPKTETKTA